MFRPRSSSGRPPRAPLAGPARRALVATVGACAILGLSACRENPDPSGRSTEEQVEVSAQARAERAPERVASTSPPVAPDATSPADALVADPTSPDEEPGGAPVIEQSGLGADGTDGSDAPDAAVPEEERAAQAAREAEEGTEADDDLGAVRGTTADSEADATPKPIDPWRLIGQPYLVDDEAPTAAADGTTTFTLWFRTKGDFRGVRAGTSVTDDRHYKVGLIAVPELPAYVPGGVGMVQLSERMKQKGRFCWTAEVHQQGNRGEKRFAIRRAGAELQVEMDLRGAPMQRRTATVVVRNTTSSTPPVTPVEKALACRG